MLVYPYDIEFTNDSGQGYNGRNFGLIMEEYPTIPAAEKIYNTYEIPGRDGELVQDAHTKKNITFQVPLTLLVPENEQIEYREYVRHIQQWLRGSGWVRFSDTQQFKYRVLACQFMESERITPIYGKVAAEFTIEPYEYANNGLIYYPANELRANGFDLCRPLYKITGETVGRVYVNDYEMHINVGQNLIIDTKQQLTYRLNDKTILNTAITADYKKLWLDNGPVTITATEGLTVEVMPQWGFSL